MLYLGGEKVFMLGLVVIYWAIWKARIKLALRKKKQLKTLLRCSAQPTLSFVIGQVYTQEILEILSMQGWRL
jgi:hypothetical protein